MIAQHARERPYLAEKIGAERLFAPSLILLMFKRLTLRRSPFGGPEFVDVLEQMLPRQ
jgi:hypothetical protein